MHNKTTLKFYSEIGKKIQKIRRKSKVSQELLAEKIGKGSATYIALVESGKRRVSLQSLLKIADALHVPMNFFLDNAYHEQDANQLLHVALVADQNLTSTQKHLIKDFVEFLRSRDKGI